MMCICVFHQQKHLLAKKKYEIFTQKKAATAKAKTICREESLSRVIFFVYLHAS